MRARAGRGRVTGVDVERGTNKYALLQVLQVLGTALLSLVHVVFYMTMLMGLDPLFGIGVGVLEIAVSRMMSAGSALGILRLWLLAAGACTTAVSVGIEIIDGMPLGLQQFLQP